MNAEALSVRYSPTMRILPSRSPTPASSFGTTIGGILGNILGNGQRASKWPQYTSRFGGISSYPEAELLSAQMLARFKPDFRGGLLPYLGSRYPGTQPYTDVLGITMADPSVRAGLYASPVGPYMPYF